MSNQTIGISEKLNGYIQDITVRESNELVNLRERTKQLKEHKMQIAPEQGQFMSLLVNLTNARNIIEIGVFTGYSTLCMAKELPVEGQIIGCDLSEEWTEIAKEAWRSAGVENRIDLRIAPANETLVSLVGEGLSEHFDMVFIDADKANYLSYYEQALMLVRKGGLIMIDNTLWSGSVADQSDQSEDTRAIRALNTYIANDDRVKSSLLPIADGLTLAYKR
jgi:caffeoyl-CoA O-methyltransferase